MGKLIYSTAVSLDGFIAGPDGKFGWAAPDEELHRFHNAATRELGGHLCGRGLYETMVFWETAEQSGGLSDVGLEFARIWRETPKIVFSTTLHAVEGNARLASESVADEVAKLRRETDADLGIGGAGLASTAIKLGLLTEYRMFINPLILGGGTPCFPSLDDTIGLELQETRTFGSRVLYARYGTSPGASG